MQKYLKKEGEHCFVDGYINVKCYADSDIYFLINMQPKSDKLCTNYKLEVTYVEGTCHSNQHDLLFFITFHDLYSSLTVKFCLCTRWELKRAKNLSSEF